LSPLVSVNNFELPRSANIFHELFLVDYNGNLVDIPVMISNIPN